jgi:hypothetical protein
MQSPRVGLLFWRLHTRTKISSINTLNLLARLLTYEEGGPSFPGPPVKSPFPLKIPI